MSTWIATLGTEDGKPALGQDHIGQNSTFGKKFRMSRFLGKGHTTYFGECIRLSLGGLSSLRRFGNPLDDSDLVSVY